MTATLSTTTTVGTASTSTTIITFIGAGTYLSYYYEYIIMLIRNNYLVIMRYLSHYYEITLSF